MQVHTFNGVGSLRSRVDRVRVHEYNAFRLCIGAPIGVMYPLNTHTIRRQVGIGDCARVTRVLTCHHQRVVLLIVFLGVQVERPFPSIEDVLALESVIGRELCRDNVNFHVLATTTQRLIYRVSLGTIEVTPSNRHDRATINLGRVLGQRLVPILRIMIVPRLATMRRRVISVTYGVRPRELPHPVNVLPIGHSVMIRKVCGLLFTNDRGPGHERGCRCSFRLGVGLCNCREKFYLEDSLAPDSARKVKDEVYFYYAFIPALTA